VEQLQGTLSLNWGDDATGDVIGMVGQAGQVYVRVEQLQGTLSLNWGDDATGDVIGMVGQAGQVYVRVEQLQGTLSLNWGDDAGQSCTLPYYIDTAQLAQPLIKLQAQCVMEQ
jgi:outer membrane usher protein FimD/PapC